jgi:short-subunit dehydrogenase
VQLSGKVVVVTGASRGIGAATVRALAGRGATVVATARDTDALVALTGSLTGSLTASYIAGDVRDPGHAEDVVRHALDRHGRLDAVVANAGIGYAGPFTQMTSESIDDLLDIDTRAPFQLARAALPALAEQHESALVFVTSISGALLVPRESAYSAAKAAVEALAEVLRDEMHDLGVHVGTVLPGAVRTEFFERRGAPYDRRFPRPIPPERVARGVLRVIEDSANRVVVPGWLRGPMMLRQLTPGFYRALSRRYG